MKLTGLLSLIAIVAIAACGDDPVNPTPLPDGDVQLSASQATMTFWRVVQHPADAIFPP